MENAFSSSWKLWADTEGGREWIRPDIKDNECFNPFGEERFLLMLPWLCRATFEGISNGISGWMKALSLPILKTRCTPCVCTFSHYHFWWQFRVSHFSGVEMWEGERREYIMSVRAHMSWRRWFQYHVTVLRVFHATVPISSVLLFLPSKNGRNSAALVPSFVWGFCVSHLTWRKGIAEKSGENFVESCFPDCDFYWTFIPLLPWIR